MLLERHAKSKARNEGQIGLLQTSDQHVTPLVPGCGNDSKQRLATHHALIRLGGSFGREDFIHRAHAG